MRLGRLRLSLLCAVWATAPALTGCGSSLAVFSPTSNTGGSRLLESARTIRDATPPPPVPRELAKAPLPPFIVEPGDTLLVTAIEPDAPARAADLPPEAAPLVRLPGDQVMMQDGTIDLGRYGRIAVAGRTVDQMAAEVRQAILAVHPKYAGTVDVRIVSRVSKVYYVLGQVNAPGSFPLAGRETVLDGIIAAGGLNDRASQDNIILSRPTL